MTSADPVRVAVVYTTRTALDATLRSLLPARAEIVRTCEHCSDPTHGRPRLANSEVSFSVSHSSAQAVIAVSDARVGVDLELVRERPYLDRLAARTLSPTAFEEWQAAPEPLEAFLRAWTMKEAYLKATGIGIATTLAEVPEQPAGWTVQRLDAPAGYVASIAIATEQPVVCAINESDGTGG